MEEITIGYTDEDVTIKGVPKIETSLIALNNKKTFTSDHKQLKFRIIKGLKKLNESMCGQNINIKLLNLLYEGANLYIDSDNNVTIDVCEIK